ncbi:MAG: UDP-N-acetylmuramoyl-L-alanyl-D-glutamate--2,6-diaminopimelate ligase [Gammaproteobacteria bacterium 39-13]|nr:UDP-N-acetylmuramoyl-L-alanyl-D-glutamate--2,6-diaminopimelate ligase [Gammaproteobacteria bacterium]OJV91551.1 MAG: UDP-N-acetylmuramoyl-L-alanyl-D-glutamate--2,6-diaminopimelate ligase [Gammaproteobacteria bacterium 39-13]
MKLQQLLQGLAEYREHEDHHVSGLSLNTQHIQPGELFIALKGHQHDGRTYIKEAISRGASAIICEAQGLEAFHYVASREMPIIPVSNLASKLSTLASRFYDKPSAAMKVIGITGTNGKTTSSFLLSQSLSRLNIPCAVLGTLGYGFLHSLSHSALTTPDALSLQRHLKELKDQGAEAVAMEVSSHGLAQDRVSSIEFCSAIFTNLTQDHLDYHGNMEAYGQAKQKLFQFPSLKRAIINADSDYYPKIMRVIRRDIPIILHTVQSKLSAVPSQRSSLLAITLKQLDLDQKGITAVVETPWGQGILRSPLLGMFNVSNLLGVLAELCLQGADLKNALAALSQSYPPPGRMQRLGGITTPQVIIDYAHTPDALENALKAARKHCRRRLWCVFGCGGDRDKDKRAKMGHIAGLYADRIVITNDNPRTENPRSIIDGILEGLSAEHHDKIFVEEDRQSAIEHAISRALAVDTILVAGKGHEDYQIIGDQKFPFSDVECVKTLLKEDNNEAINYR